MGVPEAIIQQIRNPCVIVGARDSGRKRISIIKFKQRGKSNQEPLFGALSGERGQTGTKRERGSRETIP